jgi:tetratricopeptide (TPR) repeat protein
MARASTQRRRRRPRPQQPARSRPRTSAEDLMFFPKLRRRAKWVFAFLAGAFALSFVFLGVGTGVSGANPWDALQGIFTSGPEGVEDVEDAREKALAEPRNREAQLAYANALRADGQLRPAITVLEQYTQRRPRDVTALRQLAILWGIHAAHAREEAQVASAQAQQISIQETLAPSDEAGFFREIAGSQISETLAQQVQTRATEAQSRAVTAAKSEAAVWQDLTLLQPEDEGVFLQLGIASQNAGDVEAAIAAYERFLELAPDDSRAEVVQQQIDLLKGEDAETEPESSG